MIYADHSDLRGKHSFLSPSKAGWLNDDEGALIRRYINSYSSDIGTALHEYACNHIKERIKITKGAKNEVLLYLIGKGIPREVIIVDEYFTNVMTYTNDAIMYRMDPEVILYYSDLCFGTTDAISFENNFLRIHDLKTGASGGNDEQLLKYASLFCLERKVDPEKLAGVECRFYQNQGFYTINPTGQEIRDVMNRIIFDDEILQKFRKVTKL